MIGLFQVMISLSVRPRRVIPFLWNKQTITSLHGCVIELHLGQSGIFFKIYPVRVKSSFSSTVWFNRQNLCFKEHTKPWLTSVAPLPERRREESDLATRGVQITPWPSLFDRSLSLHSKGNKGGVGRWKIVGIRLSLIFFFVFFQQASDFNSVTE